MKEEPHFHPEDQLLKELFQRTEKHPLPSLKSQIMLQIESEKPFVYEPVIGKRMWWFLGSGFVLLLAYLLFAFKGSAGKPYVDVQVPVFEFDTLETWSTEFTNMFDTVTFQLPEIPFSLVAAVSVFVVLGVSFMVGLKNKAFYSTH